MKKLWGSYFISLPTFLCIFIVQIVHNLEMNYILVCPYLPIVLKPNVNVILLRKQRITIEIEEVLIV